jgi:hypothetical protein
MNDIGIDTCDDTRNLPGQILSVLNITSASRTLDPPVARILVIYSRSPIASMHEIVTRWTEEQELIPRLPLVFVT